MTFLEELQSYRGGILRIKSELYWYGGRGWDGTPGWICLVLDAADVPVADAPAAGTAGCRAAAAERGALRAAALLLIDGKPQWIWVDQADVELIA